MKFQPHCLSCGNELVEVAGLATIACLNCGHLMIADDELNLRDLTEKESDRLTEIDRLHLIQAARMALERSHGYGRPKPIEPRPERDQRRERQKTEQEETDNEDEDRG